MEAKAKLLNTTCAYGCLPISNIWLMRLKFTKHASQQLKERGISKELVRLAIQRGAKARQGKNHFVASYTYIRVAFKTFHDVYLIKTVMIKEKLY